ncbi:MAG: T9SS type A sorting domain-containing protein [Sphingobacteriales bacterium]|nr:T9SS type A sorting domain-containing protein [Sphingobacteriales bacterium]
MNSRMIAYLISCLMLILLSVSLKAQDGSINFDGYDDIAHTDGSSILNLSTSGTVEAWINVDVFKIAAGIVHKGDATDYSDEEYSLQFYWGTGQYNKLCFVLGHSNGTEGTTWNKLISNTNFVAGEWYHVAIAWNSTNMYIYVNGNLDNSRTNSVMPTAYTGGLNIGSQCYTEPPKRPFDGKIDEVRVWNTTRTQTEIRENMYKQLTGSESGLVAYYDFEEGSGNTLLNHAPSIIDHIVVESGGSYTTTPTVTISGGGGSGASASAVLKMATLTLYNGGTNYRSTDYLNVDGGTYTTRAQIDVTSVSGRRGPITGATIYNAGAYSSLPSNPFNVSGGSGSGAMFNATWSVNAINLTNAGSGYTSAPTITFNPTGATATAVLSDCDAKLFNSPTWSTENAPLAHAWLGTISTDWSNAQNWFAGWSPNAKIPVRIKYGASRNCVIGVSTNEYYAECEALTIDNGTTLTINPGNTLRAHGNTGISGVLIFESDTSCRTGNFIDNGNITYSGSKGQNVTFKKYITKDKWHYNSVPIEDATSNVFWGMALYNYDEPSGAQGTKVAWKKIGNDVALTPGIGYDAYVKNSDKTIIYNGGLNTGTFLLDSLTRQHDGFNFVGNPYPSAIDWDANGWQKSNLDDAIYIWDPNLNNGQGNYMSYVNGVGSNGGSRYIPATQGFWVRVSSGYSTGYLQMSNDIRVNDNTKYRAANTAENTVRVICKAAAFSDEAVIRFSDEATGNFDAHFDASKFFTESGQGSMIYSTCPEGPLSVNSLPFQTQSLSIPLFTKVLAENQHSIEIKLENFDYQTDIFLEDQMTGIITDMKKGNYTYYAKLDDQENRFILHFGKVQKISAEEKNVTGIQEENTHKTVKVYSAQGKYLILSAENPEINAMVNIFDLNGKLIDKFRLDNSLVKHQLTTSAGIVIVQIINGQHIETTKIILH